MTTTIRTARLRKWLEAHNARWLVGGTLGTSRIRVDAYVVNGCMVAAVHDGSGWDLLVPSSRQNNINATLRAAETACGLVAPDGVCEKPA